MKSQYGFDKFSEALLSDSKGILGIFSQKASLKDQSKILEIATPYGLAMTMVNR